ncbi:MAG: efflux RND transporter periplasmic adaptor subunit [Desulfobacterales bacterium]
MKDTDEMKKSRRRWIQVTLVIVLITIGGMGNWLLKASRPPMETRQIEVAAPLARTVTVNTGSIPVPIQGHGTVRPLQEIQLIPQVAGKVVDMSPAMVDGGAFKKGDILLSIDPADYRIAVTLAEARVKDAESKFILARQEASVARSDWLQLNPGTEPPTLVAKKPQLETAQANLAAQEAELERAKLNLERTRLKAPFDGRVSRKNVDIGQYVSPGQATAVLYSIDAAEIVVPMESDKLEWFDVPGFTSSGAGSSVSGTENAPKSFAYTRTSVVADIAGRRHTWPGIVVRAEGNVDERTRMINVVVRVDAPHSRKPPLAPGIFVTVNIDGRPVENGALIPRAALREDDTVWVVDSEGRLTFRTVETALYTHAGVVIKNGLEEGEQIVVSPIKEVTDGMLVRNVPANNGGEAS